MAHNPPVTAFQIPLTEKQFQTLGRISAIWAQVDFLLDQVLMHVNHLNQRQLDILVGDRMVGAKVVYLEQTLIMVEGGPTRDAILEFIKSVNAVKGDRNHAAHGVWGIRMNEKTEYIAARASRTPSIPLRAERLKQLEKDIAACSVLGHRAFGLIAGLPMPPGGRFLFGAAEDPPSRVGESTIPLNAGRPIPAGKPVKAAQPPPPPPERDGEG